MSVSTPSSGPSTSPCWFVSAVVEGRDQTDRFIDKGVWEHGFDDDRIAAQVRSMRPGDRIAIQASHTQKHGLPFDTNGNTASVMKIMATGVVAENTGDGRQVRVHWQRISAPREWFFYTHSLIIWRVLPGEWQDDALIAFTFENRSQDLARFRNSPFWRDRFGDASTNPHRFRWVSFYQAMADAVRAHRRDRQPLIRCLQEAHSKLDDATDLMRLVHRIAQTAAEPISWRNISRSLSQPRRVEIDSAAAAEAADALMTLGLGEVSPTKRGRWAYRATRYLPMDGPLSRDFFSDGRRGFIVDIDPFTLFGLFNRHIPDRHRQATAMELAGFLGVEEAVPKSFAGIPVLNNQRAWFFPYDRDRDPAHIEMLWNVFELGLDLADSEGDDNQCSFRDAFDQASQLDRVGRNLSIGLFWCRPWSFLSLDKVSRLYITEKLRLPIDYHAHQNRCDAREILRLIDILCQRFQEADFPIHSFPELSLEAWSDSALTLTEDDSERDEGENTGEETDLDEFDEETPWRMPASIVPTLPAIPYGIADILSDGCFHSEEHLATILQRWQDKKNLILQGPPGTGKTWLARRLGKALIGHDAQEPQLRSVQFHPNLSYEDFVRGWRPSGNGSLALHDGVVLQMVNAALAAPSQRHVLVIDEINRGNPAQIFGELLTLLEAGKRTPREAMQLCYPDPDGVHRLVHVPENLFVIGTMNIADRSLALVDMAFRRRFAFIDLEPSLGDPWRQWVVNRRLMEPTVAIAIEQRLEQLNSTITADTRLGKAFRIGHSYVTPSQSLEGRSSRDWFAEVVATELRPLLHEYWFDTPDVADREADRLLEGW